jgi:hypothetical protein
MTSTSQYIYFAPETFFLNNISLEAYTLQILVKIPKLKYLDLSQPIKKFIIIIALDFMARILLQCFPHNKLLLPFI